MKKAILFTVLVFAAGGTGPLHAQGRAVVDQTELRRDLGKAFEPLKSLNEQQMAAVAGLLLASRAGIAVGEYCPPIKQFEKQYPVPCVNQAVSYSSAVRECKKPEPTWKECPKVLEAEANWAVCETQALIAKLQKLKLVGVVPPKPGPQPKPLK